MDGQNKGVYHWGELFHPENKWSYFILPKKLFFWGVHLWGMWVEQSLLLRVQMYSLDIFFLRKATCQPMVIGVRHLKFLKCQPFFPPHQWPVHHGNLRGPAQGSINHWFPLIRPAIRALVLGGGGIGGVPLDCHDQHTNLKSLLGPHFMTEFWFLPAGIVGILGTQFLGPGCMLGNRKLWRRQSSYSSSFKFTQINNFNWPVFKTPVGCFIQRIIYYPAI